MRDNRSANVWNDDRVFGLDALRPKDPDNPLKMTFSVPAVSDPDAFMERFGIKILVTAFGMTEVGSVTYYVGHN